MIITYKKIDDLIPYANNPRKNDHAINVVASSIKNYGFRNPIIIDQKNEIVAGHTRYLAAKKLNIENVPCTIIDDLTHSQIKAFRLIDNKTSEFAQWDYELLDLELEDLDIDMELYNFDSSAIEWEKVEEINKENYEKPETERLRCPMCNGIDEKIRFKKISEEE